MIWAILWFVVGFITFLLFCAEDMRGMPYNQCFTDQGYLAVFAALFTFFGCISLVLFILWKAIEDELFSKLVYWLCNIGVKKDNCEEV